MMSLRKLTAGAALVLASLLVTTSASAQMFQPGQLTSADRLDLVSSGPYSPYGTYTGQFLNSPGQPTIDIWCVDFLNGVAGLPVDVNITSLAASATDLNVNTRYGASFLDQYKKAAYLTQFFATAGSQTVARDIHCTIWQLFSPGPGLQNCNGASTASWLTLANTNFGSGNYRYWFVVSDVALAQNYGNTAVNRLQVGEQEFLVYATPEPGTYVLLATGLVGLSLAGMRRRRKN